MLKYNRKLIHVFVQSL